MPRIRTGVSIMDASQNEHAINTVATMVCKTIEIEATQHWRARAIARSLLIRVPVALNSFF